MHNSTIDLNVTKAEDLFDLGGDGFNTNKNLKNFDCADEAVSGSQWVKICKQLPPGAVHGQVPFFENNKYSWMPVQVEEYDEGTKKYLVTNVKNNKQKWV